jgi:hypothetical protein
MFPGGAHILRVESTPLSSDPVASDGTVDKIAHIFHANPHLASCFRDLRLDLCFGPDSEDLKWSYVDSKAALAASGEKYKCYSLPQLFPLPNGVARLTVCESSREWHCDYVSAVSTQQW